MTIDGFRPEVLEFFKTQIVEPIANMGEAIEDLGMKLDGHINEHVQKREEAERRRKNMIRALTAVGSVGLTILTAILAKGA